MQAQSYPPEHPSSSRPSSPSYYSGTVRSPNPSSASHRTSRKKGPHLPPPPGSSDSSSSDGVNRDAVNGDAAESGVSDSMRQAAQLGDFRAIAALLNHRLSSFHITTWVGEAGPGYLQITITVKRPPKRQPLIRLISHQLYSLHSDVILGANLTVQLVETNLILWNQLVRLPLPEVYKQPSRWERWQETVQTSVQSAKRATQSVRLTAQSTWQTSKTTMVEWVMGDSSHPFGSQLISQPETPEPNSLPSVAAVPTKTVPVATIPRGHTEAMNTEAMNTEAMNKAIKEAINTEAIKQTSAHEPPPPQSLRDRVAYHLVHPSPWVLGGAAIAAFTLGGGLDILTRMSTRAPITSSPATSDPTADSTTAVYPNEPLDPRRQAQERSLIEENGDSNLERATAPGNGNPSASLSQVETNIYQVERPKTVQTSVGDIEVVTLAPATPSQTDITLTFSSSAIVPLPTTDPSEPEGWRWPFSPKSDPVVSHPADMAIALLDTPSTPSSSQPSAMGHVSDELLHQGGIDLVNIASNNIIRTSDSSLSETLETLKQASILPVGAGLTLEDAARPQVVDIKGQRIAVLGYVDTNLYKANGDMPGNNPVSLRRLVKDIEALRDQVDWVIVTYQWEADQWDVTQRSTDSWEENQREAYGTAAPSERQAEFAHLAVDHGADLVVGHNAATMQGSEIYNDRAIVYSLGPVSPSTTTDRVDDTHLRGKDQPTPIFDTPLDGVNHSLPASGIREMPSPPNGAHNQISGDRLVLTQGEATPTALQLNEATAMLKVIIRDRQMGIEFIPVIQGETTAEFVDNPLEKRTVQEFIHTASQALETPLPLGGRVWVDLDKDIEEFSNSAAESFKPNSTTPFIDEHLE